MNKTELKKQDERLQIEFIDIEMKSELTEEEKRKGEILSEIDDVKKEIHNLALREMCKLAREWV